MDNAQLQTLRTAILADATLAEMVAAGNIGPALSVLNAIIEPVFIVWRSSTATQEIYDAITWAKLTPNDTPDGTALWTNRALSCQGKQFNVQTLLQGRESINSARQNVQSGLQDALTNVPSGAGGATVSAGWAAVRLVMQRQATRGEKVFAIGPGTAANPASLGFEGMITDSDIEAAMRI